MKYLLLLHLALAAGTPVTPVAPAHTRLIIGTLSILGGGLLALDYKGISSVYLSHGRRPGWPNWYRVVGGAFALAGLVALFTVVVNP